MQELDYSQKQATVTIKEYKKDGSYKLINQKFTPFSYALGSSSTKTVNFFDAANREINKPYIKFLFIPYYSYIIYKTIIILFWLQKSGCFNPRNIVIFFHLW